MRMIVATVALGIVSLTLLHAALTFKEAPEISLMVDKGIVMINGGHITAPEGVGYWLNSTDGEYRLMIQEGPNSSSYTTFLIISEIKLISSDNGGGMLLDGAHFEIADTFKMDGVRLVNVKNDFSAQRSSSD
ncbi:hypothetical protein [Pseudodesulfovibrio pelocollis]|uniref:hypothetical protein n=1 Tax=Pseudodesulfovibrio pelocollis TaxID=3051432 RepID=UPI00255AED3F|nr:hypothetical protein [Pseudodesulfovibrio sp. SB368]